MYDYVWHLHSKAPKQTLSPEAALKLFLRNQEALVGPDFSYHSLLIVHSGQFAEIPPEPP